MNRRMGYAARARLNPPTTLGISVVLLASTPALGQTAYLLEESPLAFSPLRSPTVLAGDAVDDDEWDVRLPFSFRFFDEAFDSVSVGSNGALFFPAGRTVGFTNQAPGANDGVSGFIAPFWDDLRLYEGSGGRIAWAVEGVAPQRSAAFEWLSISRFADPDGQLSFRVRLYEGPSGRIDLEYGPVVPGSAPFNASLGVEAASGLEARELADGRCSPSCDLDAFPGPDRRLVLRIDAGPDLFGADATLGSRLLSPGQTETGQWVLTNAHGRPLGPFATAIQLAGDTDFTRPIEVGRVVRSLDAYGSSPVEIPFIVPATTPPGRYFIRFVADADDVIEEVDESNNRIAAGAVTVLPTGPNLRAAAVLPDRVRAVAGSTIAVDLEIESVGSARAAGFGWTLVVSQNRAISERDTPILSAAGLSLDPGETLSETLTVELPGELAPGHWFLGVRADPEDRVQEVDEVDNQRVAPFPLLVDGRGLRYVTERLPLGYLDAPYRARLEVSAPEASFRVVAGALPPGLSLEPGGVLTGAPALVGAFPFSVEAERGSERAELDLVLEVLAATTPLSLPLRSLPTGAVGIPYRFEVPLVGAAAARSSIRFAALGLPAGLEIVGQVIEGVPREARQGEVTLTARAIDDSLRAEVTVPIEIRPGGPLQILTEPVLLSVGVEANARLLAAGGVDPLRFGVDRLPPGLELDPDGALNGRPRVAGAFSASVFVEDAEGARDEALWILTIQGEEAQRPSFEPRLPEATVGAPYRAELGAAGVVRVELIDGEWPPGLTGRASAGGPTGAGSSAPPTAPYIVEGTPTSAGRFDVLLLAEDADGRRSEGVGTLVVRSPLAPSGGCRCPARSSRGSLPILFSILGILTILRLWRLGRRRCGAS